MIALFTCLHMFTCIIPFVNSEARTFNNPLMCAPRQQIHNCSFQITPPRASTCLIYNTNACKKSEFPAWTLKSLKKPRFESNTEFTVVIEPYAFYIDEIQKNHPVSAINISLTSFNRNISGFSIIMKRNAPLKEVCRIIDFRNALDNIKMPFLFFYDCFYKLREDFWKDVVISFRAYPLNIELSYLVYIPRVSGKSSNSSCDWTPLLMIYHEGLSRNHIQLKFSNPQNDSNIIFFVVTLLDSSDVGTETIKIPSNVKNDMISIEFQSVKRGYYSISIVIDLHHVLSPKSCVVFKSDSFLVGTKIRDYSLEIVIVIMILTIISVCFLIYYLCQKYLKSATSVLKPSLLLVYFPKQLQHEFLEMWAEFLKKHHGVNVYLLYKSGEKNPITYLDDVYSKSSIIVFVVSEGLAQVFDDENSCYRECQDHYWVDQLSDTKALINNSKSGEKMFCKICFPFSNKQYVPKCLKNKGGPLFSLLSKIDETENFLCYIFNCSSKFRLLNKVCCIKHHAFQNAGSKQKDLKDLKDKLRKVIENRNVTEGNSHNILNKQSNLSYQNDETINEEILSIINENQDIPVDDSSNFDSETFPQNQCQKNSDAYNEESSLVPFISSTQHSENKDAQLLEASENFSYLSYEFVRSCFEKTVNFE